MKYLLIILLFICPFCYSQKDTTKCNVVGNTVSGTSMWNLHAPPHAHHTNDNPIYDTTFGIVETFLRDGSLLRGWGFSIDSLIIRQGFGTIMPIKLAVTGYSIKFDYDTIRFSIKIYSQPLSSFLDIKRYYKFIPISHLQDMDYYEDEQISISPNENYKK